MAEVDIDDLDELQRQITELQERADRIKAEKKAEVIQDILHKIKQFEIGAEELGFNSAVRGRRGAKRSTGAAAPKYRDPDSGATWSGMGRSRSGSRNNLRKAIPKATC